MIWQLWILGPLFLLAGLLKLLLPHRTRFDARRWGLPPRFLFLVGTVEIAAGFFVFFPQARIACLLAMAFLMSGAIGTQVVGRRWKEMVHPAATLVVILWALF